MGTESNVGYGLIRPGLETQEQEILLSYSPPNKPSWCGQAKICLLYLNSMGTYQKNKLYHGSRVEDTATLGQDFLQTIQLPTSVSFHQFSKPIFH